jgi:hypothetical protein
MSTLDIAIYSCVASYLNTGIYICILCVAKAYRVKKNWHPGEVVIAVAIIFAWPGILWYLIMPNQDD